MTEQTVNLPDKTLNVEKRTQETLTEDTKSVTRAREPGNCFALNLVNETRRREPRDPERLVAAASAGAAAGREPATRCRW